MPHRQGACPSVLPTCLAFFACDPLACSGTLGVLSPFVEGCVSTMTHRVKKKGVKASRGATGGGISQKRANNGQRHKVVPMEVLLGEKPMEKKLSEN